MHLVFFALVVSTVYLFLPLSSHWISCAVVRVHTLHKTPSHPANKACRPYCPFTETKFILAAMQTVWSTFFFCCFKCLSVMEECGAWCWTLRPGAPGLHVLFPPLPLTAPGKHKGECHFKICTAQNWCWYQYEPGELGSCTAFPTVLSSE